MKWRLLCLGLLVVVLVAMGGMWALPVMAAAPTWYVDSDVAASGAGNSWAQAFKTIPEGFAAAGADEVIAIGTGTYTWSPWDTALLGGFLVETSAGTASIDMSQNSLTMNVVKRGAGTPTLGIAVLASSPGGNVTLGADAERYIDVYMSSAANVSSVTCTIQVGSSLLTQFGLVDVDLHYWTGSAWQRCSNQSWDSSTGMLTVSVSTTSVPTLAQLAGAPLGLGISASPGTAIISGVVPIVAAAGVAIVILAGFFRSGKINIVALVTTVAGALVVYILASTIVDLITS